MQLFDADQFTRPETRSAESHVRMVVPTNHPTDTIDARWVVESERAGLGSREVYGFNLADQKLDGAAVVERVCGAGAERLAQSTFRRHGKVEALLRFGETLINLCFSRPHHVWLAVSSPTPDDAEETIDRILEIIPEAEPDDDEKPRIAFQIWAKEDDQPSRRIAEVAPWESVRDNYAASTRQQLERLLSPDFELGKGGRLIILHGAPGTGKSTLLQALAYEWRETAALHYIADPVEFLGKPGYLLDVMLGNGPDEKWRTVLLEDSGSLFAPDAINTVGEDRLSRLLNAGDGLLGATARSILIVTTNEPVSTFHAAVSRPGRCAAIVEFLPLNEAEARDWMIARDRADLAEGIDGDRTLAQLYALLNGAPVEIQRKRSVGFRTEAN